jgi:putative membrane protein insertion efficiency factor
MVPNGEKLTEAGRLRVAVVVGLRVLIRAYQYIFSPFLGPRCRFAPSCSNYALEALQLHGPWRGSWFAVLRIARCHPWGSSGYDPVPSVKDVAP